MKRVDLVELTSKIDPKDWDAFKTDEVIAKIVNPVEKVWTILDAIAGGRTITTLDDMRKGEKMLRDLASLKNNDWAGDISEDSFKMLKQAVELVAPKFQQRMALVLVPILDYFDALAK